MRDDALVRFTAHELTRADLQGLMVRSNGPALLRTLWHFGMLVLTGALIWSLRTTGWVLPLIVIHGFMLAFVFCALHETAHRTAFRTCWLNVVVGNFVGLLGFWPYRNYRVYHWDHHRFTQDVERDPELYFAKPRTVRAYHRRGFARRARRVDHPVDRGPGLPAVVPPGRAHRLRVHA